jgi:glycosyltransferase involved in cell wall biosynthesis
MTEKTNNHVPAISIGMPVYNGEKYIREALDSLLAQTFTDFELIISDNASTDSTSNICKEYAIRDSRIRYIRQHKNIGAIANFKFLLEQASGDFFMWAARGI